MEIIDINKASDNELIKQASYLLFQVLKRKQEGSTIVNDFVHGQDKYVLFFKQVAKEIG